MANTLGAYNPDFYAQEAMIWLRKALGIAPRIYQGYDEERRTFGRGETIKIRRPAKFTALAAPSTAQDMATETVTMTLDQYWEVKYALTDKEHAFTQDRIIQEHIMPAAYAIADKIDSTVCALISTVPHAYIEPSAGTAATIAGILGTQRKMFDNQVPMNNPGMMHFMVGGKENADLLALEAFSQNQGAGATGVATQISGILGPRYGFNFFANQNRPTIAYADITDFAGTITEPAAKGDTSITVGGLGAAEVYNKGTIIKFDVSGHEYAITATATMSSGAAVVAINPPIRVAEADNAAITIQAQQDNRTDSAAIAFHRDWAAIAFGRLPDFTQYPNQLGIAASSIQDPTTGLSLRYRVFADGNNSKMYAAVDALWSVKELNGDLACRYELTNS